MSSSATTTSHLLHPFHHHHLPKPKPSPPRLRLPLRLRSALSDPRLLQLAEKLEDSVSSSLPLLHSLRLSSSDSILSKSWPTRRDDPFRYTDLSLLKSSQIEPSPPPPSSPLPDEPQLFPNRLYILDGHVIPSLSSLPNLPNGVYVGGISGVPDRIAGSVLDSFSGFRDGDLFWDLNGIGAPDVAVVYVPEGCRVEEPLHLKYVFGGGGGGGGGGGERRLAVSNPRVLVVVERGGEIGIVEEFGGGGDGFYWANSVAEVAIGEGGRVSHSYVQRQELGSAHTKWTLVRQGLSSTYELVEISTGGKLSRHNLHIQQLGPDTVTELSSFHMSRSDQLLDLHSKLVLDHPRGYARQLHKCVVSHSSGKVVFDGNIQVNRYAQQTDAGQQTRSLPLTPRPCINVKPNLKIIADDVKCSHGAAISNLEDSQQLFYFKARGIDTQTARDAVVFSFGAEVLSRLPYEALRKSLAGDLKGLIADKESLDLPDEI